MTKHLWRLSVLVSGMFLFGGQLWAGAWLHEAGQGFTSASLRHSRGGRELGYYATYGLTRNVTFGLDLNDTGTSVAHVLGFARFPVLQRQDRPRIAVELGIGGNFSSSQGWGLLHKVTLSAGQKLRVKSLSGWVTADVSREFRDNRSLAAWKLDMTLGIDQGVHFGKARARHGAPMFQVELYKADDAALSYTLLPALRLDLQHRRTLVGGITYRRDSAQSGGELGLRLELWQRF